MALGLVGRLQRDYPALCMKVTPSNDAPSSLRREFHLGRRTRPLAASVGGRRLQHGALLGAMLGSLGLGLGVSCTLITDVDREKIPVTERPPFPEVDAGHFDAGATPEPGDLSDAGGDGAPGDAEDAASPGPVEGPDAAPDAAPAEAG